MNIPVNEEQVDILNFIRENPKILMEYRRFASLMGDCFPTNKPLRNALLNAYSEGVFELLQENGDINQIFFRCKNKLENNCGIMTKYAVDAVMIAAYICDRTEYLEVEQHENEESVQEAKSEKRTVSYKVGTIEYVRYLEGVALTNVEYVDDILNSTSFAIVIPEMISGYEVLGIMPNALNKLRFNKVRMVICPSTLRFVGSENVKLYEDFKEKGTYTIPKLYYAKKSYATYADEPNYINGFLSIDNEEYFGFEVPQESLEKGGFLRLNKYQDKNDFWSYPDDGMWVSKGVLDCYLGIADNLKIDGCQEIAPYAFSNLNLKEIIFGEHVERFGSQMIKNCPKLRRIVFEAKTRCRFGEDAISYCDSLDEIQWPKIMNFEQVSLYNNCPRLGDMVVYRRLLTYQNNEEVILLDDTLERVNNGAFISCDKARILIIPESIKVFETDALLGSSIEVVIFLGCYTQWKAHPHNDKALYVYTNEDSNIAHSVSPCDSFDNMYMKNIRALEEVLMPTPDKKRIGEICCQNMDGTSDEEMLVKPYGWEREMWERR